MRFPEAINLKKTVAVGLLASSLGFLAAGCGNGETATAKSPAPGVSTSAGSSHNTTPTIKPTPSSEMPSTSSTPESTQTGEASAARGEALVKKSEELCTYDPLVKEMRDYIMSKPYCSPVGETPLDGSTVDGVVFGFKPDPSIDSSDGVLAVATIEHEASDLAAIPEGSTDIGSVSGVECYDVDAGSNPGQFDPGKLLRCVDHKRLLIFEVAMGQDHISESVETRKPVMQTVIDWANQNY